MMISNTIDPSYLDAPLIEIANNLNSIKNYLQERLNHINHYNFTIYILYKEKDYNILNEAHFNFIKPYIREFPIEIKEDIIFFLEKINITEDILENVTYITVSNIPIEEIMKYNNYLEIIIPEKIKLISNKNNLEIRLELEIPKNKEIFFINKIDLKEINSYLNIYYQLYKIKINITYDKTIFTIRYILNEKTTHNNKLCNVINDLKQIRDYLINLYF